MYGKIFDSIYDGTLAEDWRSLITFQQLIVLCDADGMVDMTPQSISRRTGIPIEHIKAGLEVLEKPDKYSRTPEYEGRRIELIDSHRPWGWHIVNHEKYKNMRDSDTIRAQTRERVRRHRDKKRNVTHGNEQKRHTNKDTHSNTNTDSDIKTPVPQAALSGEIKDVYQFWKETLNHPRSNLDDKRKTLIRKHLKAGYSVDDLKSAINGCSNTPHNMGDNDRGQRYDSIELILRDSGQIDRFMGNDALKPISRTGAEQLTSGNVAAAQEFLRGD